MTSRNVKKFHGSGVKGQSLKPLGSQYEMGTFLCRM